MKNQISSSYLQHEAIYNDSLVGNTRDSFVLKSNLALHCILVAVAVAAQRPCWSSHCSRLIFVRSSSSLISGTRLI